MKGYLALFRFTLAIVDILLVILTGIAAYIYRFGDVALSPFYWNAFLSAALIAAVIFNLFGFYRPMREKHVLAYFSEATIAVFLLLACLGVLGLLTKQTVVYSRLWLGYWLLFLWSSFSFSRLLLYCILRVIRKNGYNAKRVLVLGADARAQAIVDAMKRNAWAGVKIVRCCLLSPSRIAKYVRRARIDEVWLVLSLTEEAFIQQISRALISENVAVRYAPDLMGLSIYKHTLTEIGGCPLINLYSSPLDGGRYWVKLLEDQLLALNLLLLAAPVMLVIAVLIKLSSPGPVLFKQMRHGWNGKPIKVYKFRSMYQHQEASGIVTQAKIGDARITPIGAFIRKTSLDELPQLVNVLQGRMSLVGPRPHAIEHNEYYKDLVDCYMHRFRMKPGLTGWAQINGYRGETATLDKMEQRVAHDIYYIENWSLLFDLRIIALTVIRIWFDQKAY